ncbi:MAG: xylulokinase [Chloroflexi bacterium]|nr:xylulokinase [Chloroflexota bacterium]
MAELILAHDTGTTGNKASLFDAEGRLLCSAFVGYQTHYPRPGWAEQNPQDWWRALCASTARLLSESGCRAQDIAVVAFSGEMMSCLPVDADGEPLRSAIIWADQRAYVEAEALAERVGREEVYRITGHRAGANYTAPKMLWLREHQPDIYARMRRVLQAKDYMVYRLTGEYATDYSDASGTLLFDLAGRHWPASILEALDIAPDLLPAAHPSAAVVGAVTQQAAQATGLAEGTPVVIGGGDGGCATVGAGVVRPGDAYNYVGSSSWISFVSREPLHDPQQRTFTFAHLDPEYVFPTGTMQCAGGSYDWLERVLRGTAEESLYRALDAAASDVEPGAQGLLFLPYLIGERSPHWNPKARAAFVGLAMTHGRAEMARAVMEGVAFNLRLILDAFRDQGASVTTLRLIGGGARSRVWRQILADVLNVPILRPRLLVEATSLGAAIAGGVGVGLYPDYTVADRLIAVEKGEEPAPTAVARYEELYALFQASYHALVPVYEGLAKQYREKK